MKLTFPKIAKNIFEDIPKNYYPVSSSSLFIICWIWVALDKSLTSMLARDLFRIFKFYKYKYK
ncbi:MAG: hypothetical protein QNJ54_36870 [Prochloraceae cyanobacterium]|nr:hypothetical protein [Prochloraceae cyanobacterium]